MQELTSAMQAHLAQTVTSLATCWKIARRDGVVQGFTDHDRDLTVAGLVYRASTGMVPSAVMSQAGLSVDNLELEGMLRDDAITRDALMNGLYDHAELSIFMVDYTAPDAGSLHVKTGWLGEVVLREGVFSVEVRGLTAALQQTIGEVYAARCRAKLGDARCKKNLTGFTKTGTVTAVESVHAFVDDARGEANGYFSYGKVTFTNGANAGLSMEVRDYRNGRFGLFLPLPHPLVVGDAYSAVAGCDKHIDTCATRFANAVNFRGEPHLPGTDKIFETPSSRNL